MTQEELNALANEFYDYLANQKDFYEVWPSEDDTICVDISWGDWKHDHLRLDHIAEDFFREKGYDILNMDTEVTDEDGSDTYSATHSYRLRKHVEEPKEYKMVDSNSVKVEEETLKEESNGKGNRIAKLIAKAYKGRVGPFGGEDPYLDGNKVTFHSQGPNESWIFNDDGSVDSGDDVDYLVAHSDISDYGCEDEEELRDYFEEIQHFDSVKDLFDSGLSWFMEVPNEEELLRKINNILNESLKEDLVYYGTSDKFLKKYGLDKYFEFDGCDLVDKKDYSTTIINFGRNGRSEEAILKEIKEYYPKIFKKLKIELKDESLKEDDKIEVNSKVRLENPQLASWAEYYLRDVCGGDIDEYNELYADSIENDFGDEPCQFFFDVLDDKDNYLGKIGIYLFDGMGMWYEIGFEPNEEYLNKEKLELEDMDLPVDGWFPEEHVIKNEDGLLKTEEQAREYLRPYLAKIESALEYSEDEFEDED